MKMTKRIATMAICGIMTATSMVGICASATSVSNEREQNGTIATATAITSDVIMYGSLSSTSDTDYYKFTPTKTGYVNITLGVPSGADYNFKIYNSSGTLIATKAENTSGIGEKCVLSCTANKTYYIQVYSGSSISSNKYSLHIDPPMASYGTWYSQVSGTPNGGSSDAWNTYNLDKLYFKGYSKPFMRNADTNDLMIQACPIACAAMVLRNMNAVTTKNITDFRTGYYGKAYADPFTVAMAHIGTTSAPKKQNDGTYLYETNKKPYSIDSWDNIASTFGKTFKRQGNTYNKLTELLAEKTTPTSSAFKYKQGIIVHFKSTTKGEHYVVFTPANNSSGYLIYDPGTQWSNNGGVVAEGASTWNSSYFYHNWGFEKNDIADIFTVT